VTSLPPPAAAAIRYDQRATGNAKIPDSNANERGRSASMTRHVVHHTCQR
jgi:hypothetical protein